jgi:hypothetical protein
MPLLEESPAYRMGWAFLVFLEEGYVSTIEGYTYDGSTVDLDFETVAFDVKPWSIAGE